MTWLVVILGLALLILLHELGHFTVARAPTDVTCPGRQRRQLRLCAVLAARRSGSSLTLTAQAPSS
jgi:hypothetical protein